MKYARIDLSDNTFFSHYGEDCPLKILWQSLYKSHSYEEFCMLCDLNQEPKAPIELGTIQGFIYEYSCGACKNPYAEKKLKSYRNRLNLERFRRGEVYHFEGIKHMLELEEIEPGRKAYEKWRESLGRNIE